MLVDLFRVLIVLLSVVIHAEQIYAIPMPMRIRTTTGVANASTSRQDSCYGSHGEIHTTNQAIERVDEFIHDNKAALHDLAQLRMRSLLSAAVLAKDGEVAQISGLESVGAIDEDGNYRSHYLYQNTISELHNCEEMMSGLHKDAIKLRSDMRSSRDESSAVWRAAYRKAKDLVEDTTHACEWTKYNSAYHPHNFVPAWTFHTGTGSMLPADIVVEQHTIASTIADKYAAPETLTAQNENH